MGQRAHRPGRPITRYTLPPMGMRWFLAALGFILFGCSDAGLYAVDDKRAGRPDRADFEGIACVPLASGDAFPVRVLFALPGGGGVTPDVVGGITDGLNTLAGRFSVPYIKFALVGYHTVATGLQGSFVDAAAFQSGVIRYASYQEQGPFSLRAPLKLASSILSGDMQTGCKGTVARTRYLVVLVVSSGDLSCANASFNAGIRASCSRLFDPSLPTQAQIDASASACAQCELTAVANDLKAYTSQYGAGEVTIQPIYVRATANPAVSAQVAAIAQAGGTQVIETDLSGIGNVLNGLNYASLQRALTLKRLIAFNRNAVSRAGKMAPDSDGDGLSDEEEALQGTSPIEPDSDGDYLSDGVEVRRGLKPQSGNVDRVNGCNPTVDSDGDRLNDCEERVLGTDSCVSDTDGDGLPDLVELLSGTNPLVPEDLDDADRDGTPNVSEVQSHTDPLSADIAYRAERGYGYFIEPADPTVDGRACYHIRVDNIGLVETLRRPNPPFKDIPTGNNDLYLYMQIGRDNEPRGTGIGSLVVRQVVFTAPNKRSPSGTLHVVPDDFVLGY